MYTWLPLQVPEPSDSLTVPTVLLPSPQLIEQVCVSGVPESLNGAEKESGSPGAPVAGPVTGPTDGATLVMSIVAVSSLESPQSSVTRSRTVTELGPSNPAAENVGFIPRSSPRLAAGPVSPKRP